MSKSLTTIGIAGILAIACSASAVAASEGTVLLDIATYSAPTASFAWAGEDESFANSYTLLGSPRQLVAYDDEIVNPELLTGIPAPEPPALVLAGMAFGGVLCGRSLLMRRKKAEVEAAESDA